MIGQKDSIAIALDRMGYLFKKIPEMEACSGRMAQRRRAELAMLRRHLKIEGIPEEFIPDMPEKTVA